MIHYVTYTKLGWSLLAVSAVAIIAGISEHVDAVIIATPATVSAVLGIIMLYKQNKLHSDVNSRVDQLIEQKGLASHAQGVQDEQKRTR